MADIPLTPRDGGGMCILESALKPADIVVSTTNAAASRVIRSVTSSAVSHAMLYAGGGKVIEAIAEGGVVERTIGQALTGARLAVAYRHVAMKAGKGNAIVARARRHVGSGYDYGGAAGGGARSNTLVCVSALGILGCAAVRSGILNSSARFYCSELVLEAFRKSGLAITNRAPSVSSPNDIVQAYSNGKLEYIGHLRHS